MKHAIDVLLAEDNPADVYLVKRAFRSLDGFERIHVARDGEEALSALRGGLMPSLVIVDLNLPKRGGLELIEAMKAEPLLRRIPVVVLTGSDAPSDVARAYDLGCAGYLKKPPTREEYEGVAEALQAYWFRACIIP